MGNERHNCGGILKNKQVTVTKKIGGLFYTFTVEGKQCTSCSEEVISRGTLRDLEMLPMKARLTRNAWWGDIITLAVPIIGLPTVETVTDSTFTTPIVATSQVANVYP